MPKLCEYLNCKRRASYGFFNGKPKRCPTHGRLGNMKPQYSICRCRKSHPTYNEPGETRAICCSECKTETMVNVISKKCTCGKRRPTFNEPGETRAICCSECKTETMVNVINKKCKCGKSLPTHNEPGETQPICCSKCKTETMVNVKNKMCPGQGEERGCVLNKGTGSTKDIVHIVLAICFPQIL